MRQIGKATRQGVMVILTAMSLAACMIEGPEGGGVKFTPEGQTEWKRAGRIGTKWSGGLYYVVATAEGYPDQFFVFFTAEGRSYGRSGQIVDIWAVNNKLRPLTNSCVDKYTGDLTPHGSPINLDKGSKNIKINWEDKRNRLEGKKTHLEFEYTVPDSDGVLVTYKYKGMYQNEPIMFSSEFMESRRPEEDCDTVSQSGKNGAVDMPYGALKSKAPERIAPPPAPSPQNDEGSAARVSKER